MPCSIVYGIALASQSREFNENILLKRNTPYCILDMLSVTKSSVHRLSMTSPIAMTARFFSTEVATKSGGVGLFAPIGSFLVGAGFTALATEFLIFKEVREGNMEMLKKQRVLEKRIAALETKKH
mmetsp:Transcript_20215/g.42405  ORF Transcript_20215/g.42405 Transcript_20215/m.42405 type:complete len:125 (+) Transcript_20215:17-391(+)